MAKRSGGVGKVIDKPLAPEFNTYERICLKTLWNRIEYLEERIVNPPHSGSMDRSKQEVKSLRWVMEKAGAPVPPLREWPNSTN